jgi:hypothetical protein
LLTCKVSGERFQNLVKNNIQEVLQFYAAELMKEDMEKVTAHNEPESEKILT